MQEGGGREGGEGGREKREGEGSEERKEESVNMITTGLKTM